MSRSQKKTVEQSPPVRQTSPKKRYRLELSLGQILMSGFCMFVVLVWMFVFGILVGRGVPLADPHKSGLGHDFMRFIGLAQSTPARSENAAETWAKSKQMLKSLDYYQNLTQSPAPSTSAKVTRSPGSAPAAASAKSAAQNPKPAPAATAKRSAAATAETDTNTEAPDTHFTLLAASLKNQENARRFVALLRGKGYAARMEAVDMTDSGRWYRVLIGSFDTRDQALQFAAEFNEKEHQQALVIQTGS